MIQEVKIWSAPDIISLQDTMNNYLAINRDASFQLLNMFQDNSGNYVCICFVLKP